MKIVISYIILFFLSCSASVYAQDGVFTATVDRNQVAMGEQIELTFTLNGTNSGKNFRAPAFNDFLLVSGPNQSTNMQFINGAMSSSISYSYVLQPKAEGKFSIGAATVEYNGKQLQTQPIAMTVAKGTPPAKQQPGQQAQSGDISKQIGNDLFLKVVVDKPRVVQGEQVTATYKLYNRLRIGVQGIQKVPALSGFWSQDIEDIKQLQWANEVANGKQYQVATLKKVALFPQRSGTLEIDPMELNCVVQVQARKRSNDIFDQFFNDPFFNNFSNVNHVVRSEPVKITVSPLPNPPAGFGGAVGKFTMETWLDKQQTKTNDPVTLKVKISGHGNLKLLEAPAVNVPPDFERYDPKISDNITTQGNQIGGSRTFEYLLIPRHAGDQHISSFTFSYFDTDKKNYVTLTGPEFTVNVGKGTDLASAPSSGVSKEDVKLLGEDIRFIKSDNLTLRRKGETFAGSSGFYALSLSPLLSFVGLFLYMKRRQRSLGDVRALRTRKARKMAQRRLTEAKQFLDLKKMEEFYLALSRALWGYVSDKLSLPQSDLSIDAVRTRLSARNVSPENVAKLTSTIEQCEFARFAPSSDSSLMESAYRESVDLISTIENQIR